MKHHCPHCSAALDLETLQPSTDGGGLLCPHCGGNLPDADSPAWRAVAPMRTEPPHAPSSVAVDPEPSGDDPAPTLPIRRQAIQRKTLFAGAAALLLLGGLVFFIASRNAGNRSTSERSVINKRELNEYFNSLIRDGKTTQKDLDAIAAIESFGGTFIGLTKNAMPWREAEAFAKSTGGGILNLSQLGTARQEIINWLGRAHPDTLGKTTWILDGAEPLGIDSPDYGPVSTLDRPRRAFIFWPGNMPTGWEWAVQPRFDEALPFENGVARVRVGNKWGLIDTAGKELHAPAFEFIGPFTEHGCAPIYQGDPDAIEALRKRRPRSWPIGLLGPEMPLGVTCGLIDRSGKVLASAEWQDVQNHIHGFTPVMREGKWGYLDAAGKPAIPCEWDDAWRFSAEGFAVVTRNRKRGIIDRSGKIIVQPEWDGAINFCKEGIGAVRRGEKWALVDKSGRLLCEPLWRIWLTGNRLGWDDRRLDLGYIPVADQSGFTLLGINGKPLVDLGFKDFQGTKAGAVLTRANGESILFGAGGKELLRFRGNVSRASDGLHLVNHDNEFGFLGEDGTFEIPMRHGFARNFSEGLAAVSTDGKWGFIDKQGKTTIAENWDEVRDFREERAAVRRGALWGFIDRSGAVLATPRWTDVGDYACERAAVTESDLKSRLKQWSFIDRFGQMVFAPEKDDTIYSYWGNRFPEFVDGRLRVYRRGIGFIRLDTDGLICPTQDSSLNGTSWRLSRKPRCPSYVNSIGDLGEANVLFNKFGNEVMPDVNPKWVQDSAPFPFSLPPKFGLADSAGKVLVQPQWDEAEEFSPHWVRFRKGNQFGLANAQGRVVVEPEWDELEVLSVDSASFDDYGKLVLNPWGSRIFAPWFRVRNGNKVKILQSNGQPAMPDGLDAEYVDFYGSSHVVMKQTNPDGSLVWQLYEPATGIKTSFPDARALRWNWSVAQSGLLWFQHKNDAKWHLANSRGESLGYAQDAMPRSWTIDPTGFTILPDGSHRKILIDRTGKRVGVKAWESMRPVAEGRAAVSENGKWGFIDTKGEVVCPPKWDEVGDFSCGMAAVRSDKWWGFITMDGSVEVAPVWDLVMPFEECRLPKLNDKREGRWAFAKVSIQGVWGAIAPSGQLLLDPKYSTTRKIEESEVRKSIESQQMAPSVWATSPPHGGSTTDSPRWSSRVSLISSTPSWGYARLISNAPQSRK